MQLLVFMFSDHSISDHTIVVITILVTATCALISAIICFYVKKRFKSSIWGNALEKEKLNKPNKDNKQTNIVPEWIAMYENMIFDRKHIRTEDLLGQGQYGSVFKGKLILGNAV